MMTSIGTRVMCVKHRMAWLLMLLLVPAAGGCQLLGVVAAKTLPEPRAAAVYDLRGTSASVTVTADAAEYGERGLLDADAVAMRLEKHLEKTEKVTVTADEPARRIVVDLSPTNSRAISASDLRFGSAAALVRVLDAEGEELFPGDGTGGYAVRIDVPRIAGSARDARRATLLALGDAIARLFYPQVAPA